MIAFRYEAARLDGATVRGRLDAPSGAAAAQVLASRGLFPLDLRPAEPRRTLRRKASARALATVLRSLASLVGAGIPLGRALDGTAGVADGRLGEVMTALKTRVREGASLAGAMARVEGVFSPATVGLVRAGERGSGLDRALEQAAEQLEREADLRQSLRAALTYPVLLAAVGAVSVVVILVVIVPRFAALLSDVQATLPAATRLLLGLSAALRQHGVWLIGVGVPLGVAVAAAMQRSAGRRHAWLLDLPVVGPIRHGLASARACRALAALLETGAPVLAALDAAREASGDRAIGDRLAAAREQVVEGRAVSRALAATRALTPTALQYAAIGEGAGRMPELLRRAAAIEEALAQQRVSVVVRSLEPALILAFALLVAFVAAALLQAVYAVRPGAF